MDRQRDILVGVIGRPHGVRGLLRVHAHTDDPGSLEAYGLLHDDAGSEWRLRWVGSGVAELRDREGVLVSDRSEAQKLVNRRLFVYREQLPQPEDEEFYFSDLEGLLVFEQPSEAQEARQTGRVVSVNDYGGGAMLEIEEATGHRFLLPFTRLCVPEVCVERGYIRISRPAEVEVALPSITEDGAPV